MQNKTLSLFLVSLFLMSFASMGMTAPNDAPPSEPSLDSDDPLASAAGRQVVDYAQWEFDSTHFGMYATTGNAGESYEFWPCIEPRGWAYGGNASEPYFPTGPTTQEYSAYGDCTLTPGWDSIPPTQDGFSLQQWNSGVANGASANWMAWKRPRLPTNLFRSVHLIRWVIYQPPLNIDAFHSTGTGYGAHEADNILDMGVDKDGT